MDALTQALNTTMPLKDAFSLAARVIENTAKLGEGIPSDLSPSERECFLTGMAAAAEILREAL